MGKGLKRKKWTKIKLDICVDVFTVTVNNVDITRYFVNTEFVEREIYESPNSDPIIVMRPVFELRFQPPPNGISTEEGDLLKSEQDLIKPISNFNVTFLLELDPL